MAPLAQLARCRRFWELKQLNLRWVRMLLGERLGLGRLLRVGDGGNVTRQRGGHAAQVRHSFQIGVYHGTTFSGVLGYRALNVDFEKGSGVNRYDYDVVQHGPIIGLTLSF